MKSHNGFTLIELAIVLVIVTILLGGLAVPLAAQIEARRIGETRKAMEVIHDTLIGYAMSHTVVSSCQCEYKPDTTFNLPDSTCPQFHCPTNRATPLTQPITRHFLPCPDTNNNGLEELRDTTSGACPAVRGGLPWITLGVKGDDAWGNRYTYAVSPRFSNNSNNPNNPSTPSTPPTPGGFTSNPATPGTLNIFRNAGCLLPAVTSNVPVVVVSHGPQGRGALNMNGGTPLPPTDVPDDERQNLNVADLSLLCSNEKFVSRNPSANFDDLLIWLSSNELFSRVCPSGGCP